MAPRRGAALSALVIVAAALAGTPLGAQSVRGELSDARTNDRLAGVLLVLEAPDGSVAASARTGERGEFSLSAERTGSFRIRAEKAGYRPAVSSAVKLERGDTLRVAIRLSDEAIVLDSLVVASIPRDAPVRARAFYERKSSATFGIFITREDIVRTRPGRTTDLLRRIPGAQFSSGRGDGFSTRVRAGCTPAVFLDGTKVLMTGITVDDLVRPAEIEGIEIYRSMSEAPPEYQGLASGCSAILIWTRIRS
jgi:hypothetical protein